MEIIHEKKTWTHLHFTFSRSTDQNILIRIQK